MSWGAPIIFGRAVGKVTTTEFRMAIVKNGTGLGVCIVIPGLTAEELRWTPQTALSIAPGMDAHHGWVRLSPSQSPGARRLRSTGKSKNLRLITPMWPWLVGREKAPRALEVVEHRMAGSVRGLAEDAHTVDVRLPTWACPPLADRNTSLPPPSNEQPKQASRPRRLLESVGHPVPPGEKPHRSRPAL